jgi:hypothetical protein
MTTFTLPTRLPGLYELKKVRESRIKSLINNLKYHETKMDASFEKTKARIKNEVLIEPVVFSEPSFLDHTYEERPVSFSNQLVGGVRDHYLHTISVIFTGERQLFNYIPEGYTFNMKDKGIAQPDHNQIRLEIDLPELNPKLAIQKTKEMLASTYSLINLNNSSMIKWS